MAAILILVKKSQESSGPRRRHALAINEAAAPAAPQKACFEQDIPDIPTYGVELDERYQPGE